MSEAKSSALLERTRISLRSSGLRVLIRHTHYRSEVFRRGGLPLLELVFSIFPKFIETTFPENKYTFDFGSCRGCVIANNGQAFSYVCAITSQIYIDR
jgi:hypothetical protein